MFFLDFLHSIFLKFKPFCTYFSFLMHILSNLGPLNPTLLPNSIYNLCESNIESNHKHFRRIKIVIAFRRKSFRLDLSL